MRIIGGRARGRRLASPPGEATRPTGDRVREALFNIWGQNLEGVRILDVCAGSGAISLEALSRGAAEAIAVEIDPSLCRRLEKEAERLGLSAGLKVVRGDARRELVRLRQSNPPPFDLAFLDPPWREVGLRRELAGLLFESPALCMEAAIELPRGETFEAPPGARLIRQSRYGETVLLFFDAHGGQV